jgi:glucosyl-dolichyl phosphate glucuronosyltransferase
MDVSVVICTYNRALSLKGALASLADMKVPDEVSWEVVVVDNNSNDQTRSVVEQFAQQTPNLRYVFESNQGLSLARNRGIKESIGHIISFIDDDVMVAPDWLLEVKRAFDGSAVACVGGKVPLRKDLDLPDWWCKEYNASLGQFDKGEEAIILDSRSQGKVGIGANLSFRRSCFEKYGNFRRDLGRVGASVLMGEDIDFCDRLRRHGELSMYTPRAIVYQCPDVSRITKRYVLRWFFRIGEWILLEDISYDRWQTVTLLFGLPRWRYRDALEHLLKTCWRYSTGRHQDGFFSLVQLTMATGYFFGVFKHCKASLPKAVSE